MQVRFSPYNSPFVPSGSHPDIYWVGAEYRHLPHSAHVKEFIAHSVQKLIESKTVTILEPLANPAERRHWLNMPLPKVRFAAPSSVKKQRRHLIAKKPLRLQG